MQCDVDEIVHSLKRWYVDSGLYVVPVDVITGKIISNCAFSRFKWTPFANRRQVYCPLRLVSPSVHIAQAVVSSQVKSTVSVTILT